MARCRAICLCVSVALAAMAMLVLLGWGLKVEWLKSAVPGLPPIEVNVAVCFLLAGLSLWLLQPEAVPAATAGGLANKLPWRRQGGLALAWLVTLLAALTLSQYLFRWELGIDQLLFENVSAPQGGGPAPAAGHGVGRHPGART